MQLNRTIMCLTPVEHIKGVEGLLHQCGNVLYYPEIDHETAKVVVSVHHPAILFVNPNKMLFRLDKQILQGSAVEIICTASTGTNHIDMEYCSNHNIEVILLTTEYDIIDKISSTAELALSLTLSLIRNIPSSFDAVKQHRWDYEPFIGRQLDCLTAGVIGYGRLGSMYAHYCRSLGMQVLVYDPYKRIVEYNQVTIEELLQQADVISLHVHLNQETEGMINEDVLRRINPRGAYLINTSRGPIVDEADVINALRNKRLLGYATDVICDEFGNVGSSHLIESSKELNIVITPHIGGMTREAQEIAYCGVLNKLLQRLEKC